MIILHALMLLLLLCQAVPSQAQEAVSLTFRWEWTQGAAGPVETFRMQRRCRPETRFRSLSPDIAGIFRTWQTTQALNTYCFYRLVAVNISGLSPPSNIVEKNTVLLPTAPTELQEGLPGAALKESDYVTHCVDCRAADRRGDSLRHQPTARYRPHD